MHMMILSYNFAEKIRMIFFNYTRKEGTEKGWFWRILGASRKDNRRFVPLARKAMDSRKGAIAESTMKNEKTACNLLAEFGGYDMRVCDITPEKVEEFDRWNKERGISANARAAYLRSLRAVFNRMGINGDGRLFRNVRTTRARVPKRAVGQEDIDKIAALRVDRNSMLGRAQAMFLFSLLANGMPFVDLVFLKWEQVRNGYITYHRHKTGTEVVVPVTDKLRDIMDCMGSGSSPYIFGMAAQGGHTVRKYQSLLRAYNKALARMAGMAGISAHVTSYVARHTWASLAVKRGEPMAAISRALGHTSILTTETYLKEIGTEDLRRAADRVAELINIDAIVEVGRDRERQDENSGNKYVDRRKSYKLANNFKKNSKKFVENKKTLYICT